MVAGWVDMPIGWKTNKGECRKETEIIVYCVLKIHLEPVCILLLFSRESENEVAQSCLTLCDPMDCSLPGSSVHGIFQAIVLEWIAIFFSVVVQSLSHVQFPAIPWTAARQSSLSFTISQSLHKLMSIESVMPSHHLILYYFLLHLPAIFSSIGVFSNESVLCIRWPKYWSFNFSISPSNEYLGLISFRIDWFDLLAVQGTLNSLLQHHSSKASILQRSAFFMVQLSYP